MPQSLRTSNVHQMDAPTHPSQGYTQPSAGVRVQIDSKVREAHLDRLLTAEDVAERLNVSKDWVWDHSSRRSPHLPVIRMGDGTLRYRASGIEEFISEWERLSALRRGRR